jgi:hypothetical protein
MPRSHNSTPLPKPMQSSLFHRVDNAFLPGRFHYLNYRTCQRDSCPEARNDEYNQAMGCTCTPHRRTIRHGESAFWISTKPDFQANSRLSPGSQSEVNLFVWCFSASRIERESAGDDIATASLSTRSRISGMTGLYGACGFQ